MMFSKDTLERVESWLIARERTCTSDLIGNFIENPTPERIEGAKSLYRTFRYEVRNEIEHATT